MTSTYDVAVLGAGPAGSTAAAALAERGHTVILIGPPPQPGPSHTLLLTSTVTAHLRAITTHNPIAERPYSSIRLTTRPNTPPADLESPGSTLPDYTLRQVLYSHALASGAIPRHGLVHDTDIARSGTATIALDDQHIQTRHVIDARGYQPPHTAGDRGVTIGTRTIDNLHGATQPHLILSIPADTSPAATPFAVWAVPHDSTLTLTAIDTTTNPQLPEHADILIHTQLHLPQSDTTPWTLRNINTAFRPGISTERHMIVLGDAAGLVNPFTGEGLSYALDSARHAAHAITTNCTDAPAAIAHYERALERTFAGYFEASRHAARRQHLAWRVVDSAATSGHPFIVKARRAILLPEGLSGAADHLPTTHTESPGLSGFLLSCDEVLASTVRKEWPFLARLLVTAATDNNPRMRPALLFAAAASLHDTPPAPSLAPLAAAIELASLAALSFTTPPEPTRERGVDWATTTVILAGDYLLSEAARLIATHAPDYAFTFAEWLDDLISLRAATHAQPGAHQLFGTIFEFPLRLGAHNAACDPDTGHSLRDYGTHIGQAFLYAEETLALTNRRTRLDIDLTTLIRSKTTTLTTSDAQHPSSHIDKYSQLCKMHIDKAKDSLHHLQATQAMQLLITLAEQVSPPPID